MNGSTASITVIASTAGDRLKTWWASVDRTDLAIVAVALVVVILLRRPLAKAILSALSSLLSSFSVTLTDEVRKELQTTTQVLLVTTVLYYAIQVLRPPQFTGGVLERLVVSVATIAVFAGWYNLCGPLVRLLRSDKIKAADRLSRVSMEADWIERVAQFAVVLFGMTALLKVWEVDITGALTGVGVLGAGFAIAAQDLIRNLIAGMNNVSERRFSVGDAIELEGQFIGVVKTIDLRSTLVVGFDQVPRYVPNSELSNAVVKNYSHMDRRRVLVTIPLVLSATRTQIEQVLEALKTYHRDSGDFSQLQEAPNHIYLEKISDDAIDLMFYAWTLSGDWVQMRQVVERLSFKILEIVEEAGTELAYPTHTLHIDTGSLAASGGTQKP